MSRRLLDTDILSEIIKGKNAAVAARAAAYLAEQGRFTTSAVSVAEIVYGRISADLERAGRVIGCPTSWLRPSHCGAVSQS
jgi:tRNA(fMet)-specific endonuclease VapC